MITYENEKIVEYTQKHGWYNSISAIENHCKNHSEDDVNQVYLMHLLLRVGRLQEAREYIENFDIDKVVENRTKSSYNAAYLKLLILEEKYEEALAFLSTSDFEYKEKTDILYIKAFLKKKLGRPIYSTGYDGYVYQQIISYSEDRMLNYLKSKFYNDTRDWSFKEHVDLDKLLSVVKQYKDDAFKTYRGLYYYDVYFKYLKNGYDGGELANYVKVQILNGTDDIFFIMPSVNENGIPSYDIDAIMVSDNEKKRTKSQIDKFNSKYGNRIN